MSKLYILLAFLLLSYHSNAQEKLPTRYYDSSFHPVTAAQAFYYLDITKKDSVYYYSIYRSDSKIIYRTESYLDTSFTKPVGLALKFFENGRVEDSIYYAKDESTREGYHYYPDGKLEAHFGKDKEGKYYSFGFNEDGTTIPGYISEQEAKFKGGNADWMNYISHALNANVPVKNKADLGQYTVIIRFAIDKKGNIVEVSPETNLGYGMEAEVMRVVKKSPTWTPAIQYGKNVFAYRRQPITFVVQ